MTAIVGVLNRRGVAFAADSAATHTSKSGQKITNDTNKIFALSKYNPVGIAIYNNLDFMGIPWETIIKMYRDNLNDEKFDTLREYVSSFWKFVRSGSFPSDAIQEWFVDFIVECFHNEVHGISLKAIGGSLTDTNIDMYLQKVLEQLDCFKNIYTNYEKAAEFKEYKLEDFYKHSESIDKGLSFVTKHLAQYPIDYKTKLVESLFEFLTAKCDTYLSYTGLVFFGYGDKELYPSYQEYTISCALDGHYKCYPQRSTVISNYNTAVIAPFAQFDVSNTVIRAVEDDLRKKFYDNYKISLLGFRNEIVSQMTIAKAPKGLIDILNALDIDKYVGDYIKGMDDYIQNAYIDSLIDTVSYLSKEDIADMAESLVRMTCLKRHITDSQETVGGPVDVAVVTKGDGFIWMKRKHYFDPKLNTQFFERYNK